MKFRGWGAILSELRLTCYETKHMRSLIPKAASHVLC